MKYEIENRLNNCIRDVEKKINGSNSYASFKLYLLLLLNSQ